VDALNPDQSKQWVYIPSLLITIKYQWFCVSIQISHLYVLLQSREQLIQISRIRGHSQDFWNRCFDTDCYYTVTVETLSEPQKSSFVNTFCHAVYQYNYNLSIT
jgi:hypothetical protein